MALETLKNVTEVNNHKIIRLDEAKKDARFLTDGVFDWDCFDKYRETYHISIAESQNMISFKIQNGPIKEFGHNGVQIDEIIATAKLIIEGLNSKFPCEENIKALGCLEGALYFLNERKRDRAVRGVEGKSKA